MVDVFLKLEALGEWKRHLIAIIAHLGCIKLRLKILSGNVSHRHIWVVHTKMTQRDLKKIAKFFVRY